MVITSPTLDGVDCVTTTTGVVLAHYRVRGGAR
jgi:hypothetical protein